MENNTKKGSLVFYDEIGWVEVLDKTRENWIDFEVDEKFLRQCISASVSCTAILLLAVPVPAFAAESMTLSKLKQRQEFDQTERIYQDIEKIVEKVIQKNAPTQPSTTIFQLPPANSAAGPKLLPWQEIKAAKRVNLQIESLASEVSELKSVIYKLRGGTIFGFGTGLACNGIIFGGMKTAEAIYKAYKKLREMGKDEDKFTDPIVGSPSPFFSPSGGKSKPQSQEHLNWFATINEIIMKSFPLLALVYFIAPNNGMSRAVRSRFAMAIGQDKKKTKVEQLQEVMSYLFNYKSPHTYIMIISFLVSLLVIIRVRRPHSTTSQILDRTIEFLVDNTKSVQQVILRSTKETLDKLLNFQSGQDKERMKTITELKQEINELRNQQKVTERSFHDLQLTEKDHLHKIDTCARDLKLAEERAKAITVSTPFPANYMQDLESIAARMVNEKEAQSMLPGSANSADKALPKPGASIGKEGDSSKKK